MEILFSRRKRRRRRRLTETMKQKIMSKFYYVLSIKYFNKYSRM